MMHSENHLKLKPILLTLFFIGTALLAISCKECPTEPGPVHYQTVLAVDYAGPSFVSLYFSISDSGQSRQYAIRRDTSIILSGTLKGGDTVVTDWQAEPATSYRYQLMITKHGKTLDTSRTVTTTTMDTSSHEFTWEKIILCNGGDIHNIEIVGEDNVWVVGEFFPEPDTGGYYFPNAAHFDGKNWNLHTLHNTAFLTDINVFSDNDIWITSGHPKHWDGTEWTRYNLKDIGVLNSNEGPLWRLWGSSSDNMYFIGDRAIVHYNGRQFSKIPNIPNFEYYRIDGIENPGSFGERIWVGSLGEPDDESKRGGLICYNGEEWQTLWSDAIQFYPDPAYREVGAIWTTPEDKWVVFYVGGHTDGIITIHNQEYFMDYHIQERNREGFIRSIDGKDVNDFFAVGDFNNVIHYNGKSFHYYEEISGHHFIAIAQKGNVVYIADQIGAVIFKGIRN